MCYPDWKSQAIKELVIPTNGDEEKRAIPEIWPLRHMAALAGRRLYPHGRAFDTAITYVGYSVYPKKDQTLLDAQTNYLH